MNVAQFIQQRIKKAEAEMDRIAHVTAGGLDQREYLIHVGKYRQLKAECDALQSTLDKMRAADSAELQPQNEEPEEDEIPIPRPRTLRRATPRSWGGR